MIIVQTAKKDTFVTDLTTSLNKGINANFGQASTLDLFKIVGENKNVKSRAMLTLGTTLNGDKFTLEDAEGNEETIVVDADVDRDALITEINSKVNLKITAYKLDSDKILLQQDLTGESGDTIPVTLDNADAAQTRITITPFRRFEHSAVLLTYDLQKIYDDHIKDLDNSALSTKNAAGADAADFKAYIRLTDVGIDSTSPRNFKLRIRPLANDFNEGLGRDIVQFSDVGDANFKTINSLVDSPITWTTEGIVTIDDVDTSTSLDEEVSFVDGNENVLFDVTDHVYEFLKTARDDGDNIGNKTQTFVIDFALENLFDRFTYFVKRLGSRNLFNKYKRPKLEIKIKDEKLKSVSYETKKRFLDNEEEFYLTNLVNKKLVEFPSDSQKLNLEFLGNVRETESINFLRNPITDTSFSITDSANNTINITLRDDDDDGIIQVNAGPPKEFDIGLQGLFADPATLTLSQAIAKIASEIQTKVGEGLDLENLTFTASGTTLNITNGGLSENNIFNTIVDTQDTMIVKRNSVNKNIFVDDISAVSVRSYKGEVIDGIKKFTIADTVLSRFETNSTFRTALEKDGFVELKLKYTATKSSVDFLTKTEAVKFYLPETSETDLFKKIRAVLDTQQKQISADDTIKLLKFSFIDTERQYKSVNVPLEIISEDLGEINYTMYNVDTGQVLLNNDKDFKDTLLLFNGSHYIANIFASSIYKNLRVGFIFEYIDPITGLSKQIKDNKLIMRFE